MLRRSLTAVIEKNAVIEAGFATEPYEAGWASEARWFLRVFELNGRLRVRPQISPDGLEWCDEGSPETTISEPGLYSFALTGFGQWLRLDVDLDGGGGRVQIYLALKE
jgi:hypothetical protein